MSETDKQNNNDQQRENRIRQDRRKFNIQTLIRGATHRRRHHIRRDRDRHVGGYVDQYERRHLWPTLGILLLSLTDATLTLQLLQRGATELNTAMAVLIEADIKLFIGSKMALTGLGLIILLIHARFRVFRFFKVSYVIYFFFLMYSVLIAYELTLLTLTHHWY